MKAKNANNAFDEVSVIATEPIEKLNTHKQGLNTNNQKEGSPIFVSQSPSLTETGIEKDKKYLEIISHSQIYNEFANAFTDATKLPIAIRTVESWRLPLHGKKQENRFCSFIAQRSSTCSICLQIQKRLAETTSDGPNTLKCPFGLCDSVVPIRIGERLIGYIQTGQIFTRAPSEADFQRILKLLEKLGYRNSSQLLRELYFSTQIVPAKQYASILTLVNIFAHHLANISNQLIVMQENTEPSMVKKAKEYIYAHQSEDITLAEVSKVVNTSTFYFCKIFKKYTGVNFTEYVARVRVERAKNLLLNPNLRVSEIAFEVGFQSLTHFNRVFKRIVGLSPTEYRNRLPLV